MTSMIVSGLYQDDSTRNPALQDDLQDRIGFSSRCLNLESCPQDDIQDRVWIISCRMNQYCIHTVRQDAILIIKSGYLLCDSYWINTVSILCIRMPSCVTGCMLGSIATALYIHTVQQDAASSEGLMPVVRYFINILFILCSRMLSCEACIPVWQYCKQHNNHTVRQDAILRNRMYEGQYFTNYISILCSTMPSSVG